jgi:lipoprotein-anchoring transpeptidase ErfK/SrfK
MKPFILLGRTWFFAATTGILSALTGCSYFENTTTHPTPSTPIAPSTESVDQTNIVKLQIFLDNNHFRPGAIDGRNGEFYDKALAAYNKAHNLPSSTVPDVTGIEPYLSYTITPDDTKRVGTMAIDKTEIEKQKSCPYTRLSDVVAERFHTTRAFLAVINPQMNISTLKTGDVVTVPNVADPLDLKNVPVIHKTARDPALAHRKILVDIRSKVLGILDNNHLIAFFPITPGSSDHPAPIGDWRIDEIATFPWFRYDEGVLERGERTNESYNFPPGPRNPVGILWMQLNRPGDGIHGAPDASTIGRAGSHGCIRLANWDAAVIRTLVTVGTPVSIE